MRTLVAFVLTAALYAQPPRANPNATQAEQIERLEKRVADGHSIVQDHVNLINLYFQQRNIEARRRHILWLIENHPEVAELRNPQASLDASAPVADPEGFARATQLWRAQTAKPDATPKAIANAVYFFRIEDRTLATSILEAGERAHADDPDLSRMRGMLDAIIMGGVIVQGPRGLAASTTLAKSPDAAKARAEVEASRDPRLVGGAASFLSQQYFIFDQGNTGLAFKDEDALSIAERWAKRAREIEPEQQEWKNVLSRVYELQAGQTADSKWKVELYRKADAANPTWGGLPQLALAEFEAADDAAAARDAHRLLDRTNAGPYFAQIGYTVLGRIALEHGDVAEAKADLLASIPALIQPGMNMEPNRLLAQDLIDHGERDIVIQFLEQSREFWKNDQGAIDHYIKVVKAPGTHDILTRYFAGQQLRGRPAPKLPINDYSGKIVAVQFRNASCKTCADDFAAVERVVGSRDIAETAIEQKDHESLVRQYEIDQFPTWVLINRDGRIADYLPGPLNEQDFERRIDQLNSPGIQQKLPAPAPLASMAQSTLAWSPVSGAESYVVQLDQRDEKGWLSDRDDHLVRVIPTSETTVALDPALGETASPAIRWRVVAVSRFGPGTASGWREITLAKP